MPKKKIDKILREILYIECLGYKGEENNIISLYDKALKIAEENNLEKDFLFNYAIYLKSCGMYNKAFEIANELLNYYNINNSNENDRLKVKKFIKSLN